MKKYSYSDDDNDDDDDDDDRVVKLWKWFIISMHAFSFLSLLLLYE